MTPRATIRLQLHKEFSFDAAAAAVPYCAALGVSHLYISPILVARPGSLHGYDVVDHGAINPELGGEAAFARLADALRRHGLGLILDIVPNHMAVDRRNWRWLDVLENGPDSAQAAFFDIEWQAPDPALAGKVLVPVLGAPYGEILRERQITLQLDEAGGRIVAAYGDHVLPIRRDDYADTLRAAAGPAAAFVGQLAASGDDAAARDAAWQKLAHAARSDEAVLGSLDEALAGYAADPAQLHGLLERQHYRLAWWRIAGDELNWRRFFDINELIAIRVDRPEVFDATHEIALRLYENGLVDGLRVDHIDGLTDPAAYCRRLRDELSARRPRRPADAADGPGYLIVEKILAAGEALPEDWPVDGTTGYDFMNEVAALLHDADAAPALGQLWSSISGRPEGFDPEEAAARAEILERHFAGQLEAATRALHRLARLELDTRDFSRAGLRRALVALLCAFGRYRTYATVAGGHSRDRNALEEGRAKARRRLGAADDPALDWIVDLLGRRPYRREEEGRAAIRFQQLSAPLAAKAVEDTAFYRYGRLLSRNDVGFDADRLGARPADFHRVTADRAARHPATLLATATHDHKRGEDVRARLAVLGDLPSLWTRTVHDWLAMNGGLRPEGFAPADEYVLYQTIVGAWPLGLRPDDQIGLSAFADRVGQWQLKALREGKLRSSWAAPDTAYEEAAEGYLRGLLDPGRSAPFLSKLHEVVETIAPAGAANGLAQALLRCTVPGVPDLYQGAEFWDFSLVDPDNRRPVDFAARAAALNADGPAAGLLESWRSGAVKQAVIAAALQLRRSMPELFASGSFEQLSSEGRFPDRVYGFVRRTGGDCVLVAVGRLCGAALAGQTLPLPPPESWEDTAIVLPPDLAGRSWRNALSDGTVDQPMPEMPARQLFSGLPVALLVAQDG
ncbi:MAG: malto-oligosyltrehalose synthase [Alphaproteobacteria bacterium]|nr:MAG: malto-oligosyltrehalose synthase [Alphaproteobacteria bacterium]